MHNQMVIMKYIKSHAIITICINLELLGAFSNELEAVRYARIKHPTFKIDGCAYCCSAAHRS